MSGTDVTVDVDIAVIGGGIGGLTLALALRDRGVSVEVFEQADGLREVGAAVALAANGSRVLQRLGLGDELAETSVVPTELQYRRWDSGELITTHAVGTSYTSRFGAPFWGIHRADLQRALGARWGTEKLHLGFYLTDISDTGGRVELTFRNGATVRAGVAIGADGIHSVARRYVCDEVPVYSGTSGFRGLVPLAAVPSLPDPGAIQFWMGSGAHLLHYSIGDAINFLAVLDNPEKWENPNGLCDAAPGTLAAAFAGWHPAVGEMVTSVEQSPRWGLFTLAPLSRWSRDRVVLLGDAAHAMLPHHGQGANQTIEDAAVLARCLAEAGPDRYREAFVRYERQRRARTRAVQRSSWDTSVALHLPDGPGIAARDARLRGLDTWLGWIHGHDAELAIGSGVGSR
jgi:salicylate hydroxylase